MTEHVVTLVDADYRRTVVTPRARSVEWRHETGIAVPLPPSDVGSWAFIDALHKAVPAGDGWRLQGWQVVGRAAEEAAQEISVERGAAAWINASGRVIDNQQYQAIIAAYPGDAGRWLALFPAVALSQMTMELEQLRIERGKLHRALAALRRLADAADAADEVGSAMRDWADVPEFNLMRQAVTDARVVCGSMPTDGCTGVIE